MPGYQLGLQLSPAGPGSSQNQPGVLLCPGSTFLMLTVRTPAAGTPGNVAGTAAGVYYELGTGTGGAPTFDGFKRLVLPGQLGRTLRFDAVRVWSANAAAPQYVQIEAD